MGIISPRLRSQHEDGQGFASCIVLPRNSVYVHAVYIQTNLPTYMQQKPVGMKLIIISHIHIGLHMSIKKKLPTLMVHKPADVRIFYLDVKRLMFVTLIKYVYVQLDKQPV